MGANVILLARNEEKLKVVLNELDDSMKQLHSYACADFSDPEEVKNAIHSLLSEENIHILINNTGGPAGGPIINSSTDEFEAAFRMHLVCNQILVQAVIPGMKSEGFGRVVNIISTSVKIPITGLGVSNTIQAVASWSKTVAMN